MIRERYILTSATNNTPVQPFVWQALKTLASHYGAKLLVAPIKYNVTNYEEITYDPAVVSYLIKDNVDVEIRDVLVLNTLNVRPTARKPLTSIGGMSDGKHMIVPSPRVHRVDNPGTNGKVLQTLTTGSVCQPQYTDTKAGKLAHFHHTYGAVIVEVSERETHIRQLTISNSGVLHDLDVRVERNEVTKGTTSGIVFGDIHATALASAVTNMGLFGEDSLMRRLQPTYAVLHDIIDVLSVSHHNTAFRKYTVASSGLSIVDEVKDVINFLEKVKAQGVTPLIVSSNHNEHLTRFLETADWRQHPRVAKDILEWTLLVLEEIDARSDADLPVPDALKLILEKMVDGIKYMSPNETTSLNGFLIGSHGDKGLNGARGLTGLPARATSKMIVGHSHSASRIDGLLTVGTSSMLTRNYTSGLSTWTHTHCLIHPNDKAQLVTQCPRTGNYTIGETNSKGRFLKEIYSDAVHVQPQEAKYVLVDTEGTTVGYIESYRQAMEFTNGSEWKAREIVLHGKERNGLRAVAVDHEGSCTT